MFPGWNLPNKIGCNDSLLSRFPSEKTDEPCKENIIRIAKALNISTDFLLGVMTVPDRKKYEIDELGLSAQAARNPSIPERRTRSAAGHGNPAEP